ncbi:phosphoribosylanthranilate isomerase [Sphingobacterium oryzagri]|uniref:N-(5'-phosphoribosyl)anthranilate isomerase n=1 Tax=Sphingobacterium oryzagri TaxID=3025669 RepID=A0ABY7WEN0_9SPHI|nr:phosphoribosylanthranilate isomerase [Sphingobacterium sp. KACC 22765]WDF68092.1 phosphoribosylanthranilate isomerase [Sphingobacterium sp. KACC 22765]
MAALQIKVCGMRDPENIRQIAALSIDYLGFIFYAKSSRYTAQLPDLSAIPPHIKKIGVFVNATAAAINEKIAQGLDGVQLHGQESPALCASLKSENIIVIKAFGIDQDFNWQTLEPYLQVADYFLFDTKSNQHGGTGQHFDWSILANYPFQKSYFLSGGLSLDNMQAAASMNDSRLIGLDLNSRFESAPALKDSNRIIQALKIINNEQISS